VRRDRFILPAAVGGWPASDAELVSSLRVVLEHHLGPATACRTKDFEQ